jgi:hypothetical protein
MEGNMKRLFFSILLFSLPIILIAQKKEISLQYEILDIPNSNIYIESVIDGRINQRSIGIIYNNTEIDSIDLKGGAILAINNYLKFNLPKDSSKVPIEILVTDISIREYITTSTDSINAKLAFRFYLNDNVNLNKIYESEVNYSTINKTGANGLENALKHCIEKCFRNLFDANKMFLRSGSNLTRDDKISQNSRISNSKVNNPVIENIKNKYFLTYTNMQGKTAQGFSVSFYFCRSKDSADWIFPLQLSIESMRMRSDFFRKSGFYSAKLKYYMPGIYAIRRYNDYLWLNLGAQALLG